jgi:hypothetical protein
MLCFETKISAKPHPRDYFNENLGFGRVDVGWWLLVAGC